MSVNLSDIAILNIKGSAYRCIISLISKNEAIVLLQNTDLTEKSGTLWIKRNYGFILKSYIRMEKMIIKFYDIKIPKQKFLKDLFQQKMWILIK